MKILVFILFVAFLAIILLFTLAACKVLGVEEECEQQESEAGMEEQPRKKPVRYDPVLNKKEYGMHVIFCGLWRRNKRKMNG